MHYHGTGIRGQMLTRLSSILLKKYSLLKIMDICQFQIAFFMFKSLFPNYRPCSIVILLTVHYFYPSLFYRYSIS